MRRRKRDIVGTKKAKRNKKYKIIPVNYCIFPLAPSLWYNEYTESFIWF